MTHHFSYTMQEDAFDNETVSEDLIKRALRQVFDDAIIGFDNFFVLDNDGTDEAIQTVFQDGQWHIEFLPGNGKVHIFETVSDTLLEHYFLSFYRGEELDLNAFKEMNIADL